MKKITKKILTLTLILLIIFGMTNYNYAEELNTNENTEQTASEQKNNISVAYCSHIQDLGWEKDFSKLNGQESGTTGRNLKNEAIKIKLIDAPENVGITYQAYLNGIGWQDWKSDGEESGTTGQNRIMEAIKVQLTGTEEYSVEYRTHLENFGWMDWKKDGEISGAVGRRLKIEAIQIRIISKSATVLYQAHVQDIGWQQYFCDGETSGVVGRKLKVEAIKIELKNFDGNINIEYQSHVQDYGWENEWKKNGEESGTTGQNKKIEAVKIRLIENYEIDKYSVMYRVYVQDEGWQDWKKDGEIAGTTGQNKKLEAIEIKIVEQSTDEFTVRYKTHVQDYGWLEYRGQGETSGVINQNKKIEAIKIIGKNIPDGISIKYKSHVQDYGWENEWKQDGEESGTTGQNKKIEAVKIKLDGTEEYSIAYRVYVQGKGWQGWANDGETAGTTGQNLRLEAIEIKIVPKISNRILLDIDTIVPQKIGQGNLKILGWVMTDIKNTQLQVKVDDDLAKITLTRVERPDVIDVIKGYGGEEKNQIPGFELEIDFNSSELGYKNIVIQCLDQNGQILAERGISTQVCKKIEYEIGTYGTTGLKVAGQGGSDLKYLKYGNGENVFFATFAIHGYEDIWDKDGQELVNIANQFYNRLISDQDYDLSEKWTIYVFPGVNMDGLTNGWTKDGPGRTTLYSQAPGNKGIDLNRCWQIGDTYTRYTNNRNYNGTEGFQAYEAQALRDFLLANKSANGQTILVDLHGWTQQLIGDSEICSYYEKQFPENDKSAIGRYGTGYMINWARTYLSSNSGITAKSALIELPKQCVTGPQSVVNQNFANRYITATIEMLKSVETERMVSKAGLRMRTATISPNIKYKVAVAGIALNTKPEMQELDNIIPNLPTNSGIWVEEKSRDEFLRLINSNTESIYIIDENGYLKIQEKEIQNDNDKKIEELIDGSRLIIFSISSICYIVDDVTGEILDYNYENLDKYQIYEYFEDNDKTVMFITENKNKLLSDNEILESILGVYTN